MDISGAGAGVATIYNIMATSKAHKVGYKVTNLKPDTIVKPLEAEVSSKTEDGKTKVANSLMQALRWAVDHCFQALVGNSQFPKGSKIEFQYDGVWTTLPDTTAGLFKGTEAAFNLRFDEVVNTVFAGFALKEDRIGEAYVRATDRGKVFEGQKVTTKIVSAQILEREKFLKDERKYMGHDAKQSLYGNELAAHEARRLKYAKSQKELKEAVQKLLGNK